ncbi:hypothetical protein CI105_04125 [Candidatus Izimaplasma bacterium ZiA1]|uniref:RnfABCDGE type electron transport complex subunit D n=1 Tax=Candidatus Izimoplasma sp. ZiA1 TaxID=2024899 RepID=UPI000BAA4A35|nr:hypothetical protein CI105_04125 [Candidatus Izimaplasma bacterium ZiA1]
MEFTTKKAPIVNNSSRSYKRSLLLHFTLIFVTLVSLGLQFYVNSLENAFNALVMVVVSVIVAMTLELFYALGEKNVRKFEQYKGFVEPINIALIIALLLPAATPIFVLILATVIAIYPAKLVYGGSGYYIFNPALVGVLFAQISFKEALTTAVGDNLTPLMMLKETMYGTTHNFDLLQLLTGNYIGLAIGTTCALLLIVSLVYLCISKVVDLKIVFTFLLSMALMSLIIGWFNGYWINFMIVNLLTGFTLFAATFLISDSVTSPTSRETKILYAVIIALMTMAVRVLGNQVEGIVFAILLGNMLTPWMNRTVKRSSKKSFLTTIAVALVIVILAGVGLGLLSQNMIYPELTNIMEVLS